MNRRSLRLSCSSIGSRASPSGRSRSCCAISASSSRIPFQQCFTFDSLLWVQHISGAVYIAEECREWEVLSEAQKQCAIRHGIPWLPCEHVRAVSAPLECLGRPLRDRRRRHLLHAEGRVWVFLSVAINVTQVVTLHLPRFLARARSASGIL